MKHLIKVTKSHIKLAKSLIGEENCPIALALRRFGQSAVCYRPNAARRYYENDVYAKINDFEYELPRSARRFVIRFDAGKSVKPFNFWLTSVN